MAGRSVNKVILVGNLGRDAETKFTPSGVARTTFSVATTRRFKDQQTNEWKDETDWHNVVLWRSENLANYLTKGKQLYIEGRLQTRSYDDKDGNKRYTTEVVAEEVILLGGRGEGGGGGEMGGGMERGSGMTSMPRSSGGGGGYGNRGAGGGSGSGSGGGTSQEPNFPDVVSDDDVPF
jgi:single-strand DNA-binding protein